ncbi:hypothetical protein SRHO_G00155680 [Serrasalmus rhombeus]
MTLVDDFQFRVTRRQGAKLTARKRVPRLTQHDGGSGGRPAAARRLKKDAAQPWIVLSRWMGRCSWTLNERKT